MKNKTFKGLMLSGILTLMFACNTKKEEPVVVDKEQIKKEIQAKEDEFAAVYNSGEVRSIGYYSDDAVSYYQNRPPLVGKTAIVEFLKSSATKSTNKIKFKTGDIFVCNDGNQVLETGVFEVTDSTNTAISTGNYMSLFEKRNGSYVCVRDMSASDK
jgi:ketosteroid isomerase-like protein